MAFLKNTASQSIGEQMIDATTGGAFTSTVTVYITGDAGTQTIGSVGSGVCTHEGNGYHTYRPSLSETNYDLIAFTFIGSGAIPRTVQVETFTAAQAGAVAASTGTGAHYVSTIIRNAMMGLAVLSPREVMKPDDGDYCLSQLNLILDDWAVDIQASYAEKFTVFASTGANPETLGTTGTWVTTRPVSIDGVAYDVGSGIYRQLFVTMDPKWWAAQNLITGGGVYGAYYAATEPNGSLYFANVPTTATNIRIMTRTTLAAVALTDAMSLAPGYESALTLTLQERIAGAFHAIVTPEMTMAAGKARGRIFANNLRISPLSTRGLGLPRTGGGRWDYRSGTFIL